MQDLPILFVDDEPDVLRALQRTTKHQGWEPVLACGPEEGLQCIAEQEFAVVVSDFRMPKMDGVEFLANVRQRWPHTERLLLTAHADEEALERGINEASISRFLRKPWRRDVLVGFLSQALEQNRLRREHGVLLERVAQRNDELVYLNSLLADRVEASQQRLIGFRRRWDAALNAISDPIIIINGEYRIEGANAAAATWAEQSDEELTGQHCYEALFGHSEPCKGCPVGRGVSRLSVDLKQNGKSRECLFDARAYRLPGEEASHICVYRDITREALFEREAVSMEKMAAIGRMAGGVAHELNNPLQGIVSFAQLAQRPDVAAEKLERYLQVIRECAIRCKDIVQSLRDYSRKPNPSERRRVSLNEVCDRALVLFESVEGKRIERGFSAPNAFCMGNANQLQQVLINLVQNALDASPYGGLVQITTYIEDGKTVLAVEDEGHGVPNRDAEKIFEPLYTTKPEGVGTGLGLAISHNIVQDHGGQIIVERASIGGARFEVRLPHLVG